jgi:hypothetical protein
VLSVPFTLDENGWAQSMDFIKVDGEPGINRIFGALS